MRERHLSEMVEYVGVEDIDHMVATLHKILDFHEKQAEEGKIERVDHHCPRTKQ